MAVERFQSGPRLRTGFLREVEDVIQAVTEIVRLQPVLVEAVTGESAGDLVVVRHGLGRVPVGLKVVNGAAVGASAPIGWYRDEGDPAWTDAFLTVRFDVGGGARVLLEVM